MKITSKTLLASLAAQASALVQTEVRFSDRVIDVGNLDLFAVTWQAIYGETGNTRAIMSEKSFGTQTNPCTSSEDYSPDLTVQVKMNGGWGQTPGLSENQMRDGLIETMWEVLQIISQPYSYEVYNGCRGLAWMESVLYHADAACGPKSARSCENACHKENTPSLAQCENLTWGHKVPSTMRILSYIDGRLQPDDLIIEFNATTNPEDGGCGRVGQIAAAVAGFIPVTGKIFAKGIEIGCAQ